MNSPQPAADGPFAWDHKDSGWLGAVNVILGAVGGAAEAETEDAESGAGGGVEEEVEDGLLVGLGEVDEGMGSLECLAEAEAGDGLVGSGEVEGEGCFEGWPTRSEAVYVLRSW